MTFSKRLQAYGEDADVAHMNFLSELKELAAHYLTQTTSSVVSLDVAIDQYTAKREAVLNSYWSKYPTLKPWDPLFIPSIRDVQSVLGPNEYVLTFVSVMGCRRPLAFLVGNDEVVFKRAGAKPTGCSTDMFRYAIFQLQRTYALGEQFYVNKELPEDWLKDNLLNIDILPPRGSTLYIVPDDVLSSVPFEWLEFNGSALRDHYKLAYLPSAAYLYTHRQQSSAEKTLSGPEFLGFGRRDHPFFGDIDTARYLHQAASHFTQSELYPNATSAEIETKKASLASANHIAFMTHSVETAPDTRFKTDNGVLLRSFADEDEKIIGLAFGGAGDDNGVITGNELFKGILINADSVVLLACDSNTSLRRRPALEAYSDLSLSAMAAGAKNVILTRWPVTAETAGDFIDLYTEYVAAGHHPHFAYTRALDAMYVQDDAERYAWVFLTNGSRDISDD